MTPQEHLRLFREGQKKPLTPQEHLREFRASKSGGSSLGLPRAISFEELLAESSKKDENFDYTTGAKGGLRAKLSFMETDEEKENLLQSIVGVEGYTKDRGGNLALTPKG